MPPFVKTVIIPQLSSFQISDYFKQKKLANSQTPFLGSTPADGPQEQGNPQFLKINR